MLLSAATCQPGAVDRFDAGFDLLNRLAASHRAQRVDVLLFGHQIPELVGAVGGECAAMRNRAAQLDDVFGLVASFHAFPARILFPLRFEFFDLLSAGFTGNEVQRHGVAPSVVPMEAGHFREPK